MTPKRYKLHGGESEAGIKNKKQDVLSEGECIVCGEPTKNIFNISFSPARICEYCAKSIFLQQAQWYTQNKKP